METVSFKLQKEILEKVDEVLGPMNFNNRTEFIRESIRDKLSEVEKKRAIEGLAGLRGSMKGKVKNLSKDELDELAHKFFEEKDSGRDIFKEWGLK